MSTTGESRFANARWPRRLAVVAVTLSGSVGTFAVLLPLTRPGWKTHEYPAITFWSVPLCLLVLLFAKLDRRWFAPRNTIIRWLGLIVLAILCAIIWTFLAVVLTGGYALAFDVSPFHCWTIGALAGMVTAAQWPRTSDQLTANRQS